MAITKAFDPRGDEAENLRKMGPRSNHLVILAKNKRSKARL